MWNLLGKNKKLLVIATILVILEIIFDLLIPVYMSDIIDEGIKGNKGVSYVLNLGIRMVLLATIAMICGCVSGILSSKASSQLSRAMRDEMFHKIQDYSFANIDKFRTPSLLTRLTRD